VADLIGRCRSEDTDTRTRGQIILVTAFALAVTLLGLAIIVNSAIFTENLATRSENVDANEALDYRNGVTQYVGDVITDVNENDTSRNHDDIARNVSSQLESSRELTGIQQIETGNAVAFEQIGTENGTRIFQENESDFTSNNSDDDWLLAEDVSQTRAFEINVTATNVTLNDFSVVVNDTSTGTADDWTMTVSESEVTVETDGETESCSASGLLGTGMFDTPFVIDVTGATVAGEACPALVDTENGDPMHFATGIDEYNVSFENGDDIQGTYSLVVDEENLGTVDDNYANNASDEPFETDAMYSTSLTLTYETAQLEYETNVTVAPGEPGDPP